MLKRFLYQRSADVVAADFVGLRPVFRRPRFRVMACQRLMPARVSVRSLPPDRGPWAGGVVFLVENTRFLEQRAQLRERNVAALARREK